MWRGFGSGGVTGVASVRRCQTLFLCLIVPAVSKMDLMVAKAELISAIGYNSVVTYLRNGKKLNSRTEAGRE